MRIDRRALLRGAFATAAARALKTFRADAAMHGWLTNGAYSICDMYAIAASLTLNERWEFDPGAF